MHAITRATSMAVLVALGLSLTAGAAEEPFPQPPYSWRGINGSGVFPAQDIVTEFHDLASDAVTSVKDAKGGERKLPLPGAPGSRKNIVWRTTLPHLGQNTPVAVGTRVFVLCEEGWKSDAPLLVCLDVKDGKILRASGTVLKIEVYKEEGRGGIRIRRECRELSMRGRSTTSRCGW